MVYGAYYIATSINIQIFKYSNMENVKKISKHFKNINLFYSLNADILL